jgi:uncharacterized oligopeptide transporter (OPT) family protein
VVELLAHVDLDLQLLARHAAGNFCSRISAALGRPRLHLREQRPFADLDQRPRRPERRGGHSSEAIEPVLLITTVVLSVLGALIGMHMITTLGVAANTSIIGALLAMLVGRVAIGQLATMRSPHRQNLAQTAVSAATFAAANSLLTPMAVLFAFGRADLVWPMLGGVVPALMIDAFMLYRLFGSRALPAQAAWPHGVAAAETIKAGDRGGRRAVVLGGAGAVGLTGSLLGLPMSAAGVAFIGNVWALSMFGLGLLWPSTPPSCSRSTSAPCTSRTV